MVNRDKSNFCDSWERSNRLFPYCSDHHTKRQARLAPRHIPQPISIMCIGANELVRNISNDGWVNFEKSWKPQQSKSMDEDAAKIVLEKNYLFCYGF